MVKAVVNDKGQLFCVQEFTQKHSINGLLFFNIRMYQHKKKGKNEKEKKMNIVVVNRNTEEHTEDEKAYETASMAH